MATIVVLGKSRLAVLLSNWLLESKDFDLVAVVPCRPQPTWCEDLGVWADARGIPCARSGRLADLNGVKADLAVSCYYNRILARSELRAFSVALNIHNSSLPAHRGMRPIEWSMRDGTGFQGVTIHAIDEGIDTGPIFGQVRFRIWPHQTSAEIHQLCIEYGLTLAKATLGNLQAIEPSPQIETDASYHSLVDFETLIGRE